MVESLDDFLRFHHAPGLFGPFRLHGIVSGKNTSIKSEGLQEEIEV